MKLSAKHTEQLIVMIEHTIDLLHQMVEDDPQLFEEEQTEDGWTYHDLITFWYAFHKMILKRND